MPKKIVLLFDGSEDQLQVLASNAIEYISQEDDISVIVVIASEEIKAGMAGAWYYPLNIESSYDEQREKVLSSPTAEILKQRYKASFEFFFNPLFDNIFKHISDISPDLLIIPHCQEPNPIKRWWSGSPFILAVDKVTSNILFLAYN